jgi:predicted porin
MNKKIIALAVAAATLAPLASAQTANPVTLYGRVYAMFENVKADGGASPAISSRNRVENNGSSLLGVRGTEDLGGGLKAFFQLETSFRPDSAVASFGDRNSGVGLQGDFGSILLGRWDTPFKLANATYDVFGDTTIAGYRSAMSDRANFNRRSENVVQYWSPNFSGFQGRVSYTANEGKAAGVNPVITSFNATYNQGPVSLAYGYELGGSVTFGPVKVAALTQRFKKTAPTFSVSDLKSSMINLLYTTGKNQFAFQHQRAKNGAARPLTTASVVEPDTKVNSLGYYYNFSRRTSFIAVYTQTKNNAAGLGGFGENTLAISPDQDPRGFAAGFRHTF